MRHRHWSVSYVKVILASCCSILASCAFTPGGGGSTQVAPDSVKVGEPVSIGLELTVWGSGGDIKGRYTDIALFYRMVGDKDYKTVSPRLVSEDKGREVYSFAILSPSEGKRGEIEYYIELTLDGHLNHVNGIKQIQIL